MKYKPQIHRNHCTMVRMKWKKNVCDVMSVILNVQQSTQQRWQKAYISGILVFGVLFIYQWNDYKFCVKCAHTNSVRCKSAIRLWFHFHFHSWWNSYTLYMYRHHIISHRTLSNCKILRGICYWIQTTHNAHCV